MYIRHLQLLRGAVKVRLSSTMEIKTGRGTVLDLFLFWVQEKPPAWMNVEAEAHVVCRHLERSKVMRDGSIYSAQVQCTLNGAMTLF